MLRTLSTVAKEKLANIDSHFQVGRARQRFLLTVISLGLKFQPEETPLIFSDDVRQESEFTQNAGALPTSNILSQELSDLYGEDNLANAASLERIGYGETSKAESLRLSRNLLGTR